MSQVFHFPLQEQSIMSEKYRKTVNIVLPILLGGGILYWMYRDFDFSKLAEANEQINWWWMLLSLIPGITAQVFRGLRWRQTLEPLGERPSTMNCIHAIFISYATSLVIPRSGEVARCGVLTKYDGTSFSKALGTVVAERIIDSALVLFFTLVIFLMSIKTFINFFDQTGVSLTGWLNGFTTTGYIVTAICFIITIGFIVFLIKKLTVFTKIKQIITDLKEGIFSLRDVKDKPLFIFYTLAIWISYFLHFYLTFFCFPFTKDLGIMTALIAFAVGSIAVVVPTPNGMGSWHFAVKTILILSGVSLASDAEMFVLIVHAIQTALIPILGVYSMIALGHSNTTQAASDDVDSQINNQQNNNY